MSRSAPAHGPRAGRAPARSRRAASCRTSRTTKATAVALLFGCAGLAPSPSHAATVTNFGAFATAGFTSGHISGFWQDGALGDFDASLSRAAPTYTAASVANLASGSLHASATVVRPSCGSSCDRLTAGASAALRDRYVFTNTGENIALIPVTLRIDGHCSGNGSASARFKFGFSPSQPVDSLALPYREIACGEAVDIVSPINLVSFIGDTSYFAYVELAVGANLAPGVSGFSLAEFGNSLKVEVLLPEGVTARSGSGVFPFRTETAVPEPATWAMMVSGFGMAGGLMRRRRRAVPALG